MNVAWDEGVSFCLDCDREETERRRALMNLRKAARQAVKVLPASSILEAVGWVLDDAKPLVSGTRLMRTEPAFEDES